MTEGGGTNTIRRGRGATLLAGAGLACSVAAAAALVWTVVPAPAHALWLVSVVAGEWSLAFGVVAFLGGVLGGLAWRRGVRRTGGAAAALGGLAVALALYPPLSVLPAAEAVGARLSLYRYLVAPAPPPVRVHTHTYAEAGGQVLQLDAYRPAGSDAGPQPAVVVVHGGGWSGGTRSDFPAWNAWLVSLGYLVFDVDYRLTPQPNWQAARDDVQAAVAWVRAHATALGVDPGRVALLGRSAGGHLALLAAYTAGATGGAQVQAVVAFYAPTDLAWGYAHPANQRVIDGPETLRRFTGGTPASHPQVYARAAPITYAGAAAPPTLLVHGGEDQLVRPAHMERLLARLQEAPATGRHQSLFLPYAQHGFDYFFNGWGAQVTRAAVQAFLREHLEAPRDDAAAR